MDIEAGETPKEEVAPPERHPENSEGVWHEVLQLLQQMQMSTYALLLQHGCLRRVSDREVHIGIVNQPLLNMAKNSQAKIEAAFSQVLGRSIRVVLEISPPPHKTMPLLQERNLAVEGTESAQDFEMRAEVGWNPQTPPEELTQLARDENGWVRAVVAGNPKTPPEALTQLARDEYWQVRTAVARNLHAPTGVLTQLAGDENGWVRAAVAWHPKTPPAVLAQLAGDDNGWVRSAVAWNAKTPPAVLAQLAREDNGWVRSGVAKNPQTPPETLIRLARDVFTDVRRNVAQNPKTPTWVLTQLAQDVDWRVCTAVAKNPRTPVEGMNWLAQNKFLSREILEGLSKRSVESLCELAAQANADLAQLMVEYHKDHPLPLEVLQAGMKGKQSELFRQALDQSSSLYVLQEAFSLLHKEREPLDE